MKTLASMLRRGPRVDRDASERGQILLIFAFGLIVFIGFAALTVDVGGLYVARRTYQNATDAAALAGAAYLTRPTADPCADTAGAPTKQVCARRAAWNYLNDQLGLGLSSATVDTYANANTAAAAGEQVTPGSGTAYSIWVSTPPNGAGAAAAMSTVADKNQVIFVRVERQRDTFFGKIFAPDGFTVSAWSTAGIFPNRWAVITLRRGRDGSEIDDGPSTETDIKIAGTTSSLTVVNGDIGGNFGLKMPGSGSRIIVDGGADEANVYLIDHEPCGSSACWSSGQIVDTAGNSRDAKKLPSFVADPNYAPPANDAATWPNGPIDNAAPALDIPNGDTALSAFSGPTPSITIGTGTVNGSGQCVGASGTAADAPKLGPGTYTDLTVTNDSCVILDPVNRHSAPGAATDVATPVPATQAPGVFYFTGKVDIRNSAVVYGNGVTVIIRPTTGGGPSQFSPGSGGVMDLNTDLYGTGTSQDLGAWTTKGKRPYTFGGTTWSYTPLGSPQLNGVGIALYVLKPSQTGSSDTDGTDVIQVSSGAGLSWKGVTYAPNDNVAIAGQPHHDGIGQLISWTFTFNGGTNVTQTFQGPGDGYPYLIEPCVLVGGACQ